MRRDVRFGLVLVRGTHDESQAHGIREATEPWHRTRCPICTSSIRRTSSPVSDQLARELHADGDKDGAKAVKGLRRPSIPVWALNQVARQQPDVVEALVQASNDTHGATGPRVKDTLADWSASTFIESSGPIHDVIEASGRSADQYELEITSSLSTVLGREALAADLPRRWRPQRGDRRHRHGLARERITAPEPAPDRKPEPESGPGSGAGSQHGSTQPRRPRPPGREASRCRPCSSPNPRPA